MFAKFQETLKSEQFKEFAKFVATEVGVDGDDHNYEWQNSHWVRKTEAKIQGRA